MKVMVNKIKTFESNYQPFTLNNCQIAIKLNQILNTYLFISLAYLATIVFPFFFIQFLLKNRIDFTDLEIFNSVSNLLYF